MTIQAEIAILGGGQGGYVAALRAAQLGAQVVLIEEDKVGGVCLNLGCIPTKSLLRSAEVYRTFERPEAFGLKLEGSVAPVDSGVVIIKGDYVRPVRARVVYPEEVELGIEERGGGYRIETPPVGTHSVISIEGGQ